MTSLNRQRGQLSLGLAFAFTACIAMLSLVLQSSLITREKMKLQQTTDFAALVASNQQRYSLNRIKELNEAIETAYERAQSLLLTPLPPCPTTYGGAIALPTAASLAGTFGAMRVPSVTPEALAAGADAGAGSVEDQVGEICDKGCNGYDAFVRNTILNAYRVVRGEYAAEILKIIQETNPAANDLALETFLTPGNLPFGLEQQVYERYGKGATAADLRREYGRGTLEDRYQIIEANRDIPLFAPKQELRQFVYHRYKYFPASPPPVEFCAFSYFGPRVALSVAKVAKDDNSDYETSFLTGARYAAETNKMIERFRLFMKDPERPHAQEVIRDLRGKELRMIQERMPMNTLALAKPYGGTFPEAGNPFNTFDHGEVGEEFKGSKLIGIADRDAIGGFDLGLNGAIERQDSQGRTVESIQFFQEDYLH